MKGTWHCFKSNDIIRIKMKKAIAHGGTMVINIRLGHISRIYDGAGALAFLYVKGCIVCSLGAMDTRCRGHVFSVSAT